MIQKDDIVITYSDLKRIFFRIRPRLKFVMGISFLLTLAFLLVKEPKYLAQATFKQSHSSGGSSGVRSLFQGTGLVQEENSPIPLLISRALLRDVVEDLGLQVSSEPPFIVERLLGRIWDNISIQLGRPIEDIDHFVFKNTKYEGEQRDHFYLKPLDSLNFEILDRNKKVVLTGKLNQFFSAPFFKGTLQKMPKNVRYNKLYSFRLNPWEGTLRGVRKFFEVKPLKIEKNIYSLSFSHRDRHLAAHFLNRLMSCYESYLIKQNECAISKQVDYLEKRQQELTEKWDRSLQEHVAYLKTNLEGGGHFSLSQEMQMLSEPKNLYTSKLFDVDLDLSRLETSLPPLGKAASIANQFNLKKTLQKEANSLSVSKGKRTLANSQIAVVDDFAKIRQGLENKLIHTGAEQQRLENTGIQGEIETLVDQSRQIALVLERAEKDEELPTELSLLKDPKSLVSIWAQKLARQKAVLTDQKGSPSALEACKAQFVSRLKSFSKEIHEKKRALEENLQWQNSSNQEFAGLNLANAQKLYLEYNSQRDSLQAQLRQLIFLSDEIYKSDFELSSIATIISDPVITDLVHEAGAIALQLHDLDNRSSREQIHLRESLDTQKKFISQHLRQTIELVKMRMKLVEEKARSLQQTTIELLKQEKELIQKNLNEITGKMESFPEKWRRENMLNLQKELGMRIIEGITQLVESKVIDNNLFQVGSSPLDSSIAPFKPKSPNLVLYPIGAAILAACAFYFYHLCSTVAKGVPVSHENLSVSGYNSLGVLSPYCHTAIGELADKDLETLRRLSQFVAVSTPRGKCCAIIGGKNPDFSLTLTELLSMQGLKVLVVHYVLDKTVSQDHVPGLWQYLNEEIHHLPIRHELSYDYLPSGGTSRHGTEMLINPKFSSFLSQVKPRYDLVLLYSSALPHQTEGYSLLSVADSVIVTTNEEKREELLLYQAWSDKQAQPCVAFVSCEEFH